MSDPQLRSGGWKGWQGQGQWEKVGAGWDPGVGKGVFKDVKEAIEEAEMTELKMKS